MRKNRAFINCMMICVLLSFALWGCGSDAAGNADAGQDAQMAGTDVLEEAGQAVETGKAGSCERTWPVGGNMKNAVRLESSMSGWK